MTPAATDETAARRATPYSELAAPERTRWILAQRDPRPGFSTHAPHQTFLEYERSATGILLPTLTVLLRSRECPWHCLMCDLWKSTVRHPIPPGAIPAQIDAAIAELNASGANPPYQIKLYNSGSFFDAGAVPTSDYAAIARKLAPFERVIVECHPRLVNYRTLRFRDLLVANAHPGQPATQLEIAMGLETVHSHALELLNKEMTLELFERASRYLANHHIDLRAFVLVQPPFQPPTEAVPWAERSARFAFDCAATAVSLIPTRPGNGALQQLRRTGQFTPPTLTTLEASVERCLELNRGRVFADLWDLQAFSHCSACYQARHHRLATMNREQTRLPPARCSTCRHSATAR